MKKKSLIIIISVAVIFTFLFLPVSKGSLNDGGTREWAAVTYKIVDWNRITEDGTYEKTRVYFGADRFKTIDELWEKEAEGLTHSLTATITEINGKSVLVEPIKPEGITDRISFNMGDRDIGAKVGDVMKIYYTGEIMETYPAQIHFITWEFSKDLRHIEYGKEWLNKKTAELYHYPTTYDLTITEIYSDCFFARHITPMPQTVKVNGTLGEEWCVGDKVFVTYKSLYLEGDKMECDLVKIEESTFVPDPDVAYKPVIYLYPEKETAVSVKLELDGRLTCTYPKYNDGWYVIAAPDGTLTDKNGQSYNYLYWEGETYADWDMSQGFCVKGKDTASFLEEALEKLGLTRREANEFIVYWLPQMEANPYNIISFQTDRYTDAAALSINPTPDTLIRVFMAYQASESFVNIEPQALCAPEREGFTAVEWGGTMIK